MADKTHQPTARRLREARKKGQIPRSRLFTSGCATVGGLLGTTAALGDTKVRLLGWTTSLLSLGGPPAPLALAEGLQVLARCAAPTLGGAVLGALVSSVAVAGGLELDVGRALPRAERIDVAQGFARLLTARQLVEVVKGLLVAVVIGWVVWRGVRDGAPRAFRATAFEGPAAFSALAVLLSPVVLRGAIVLLVLGGADWALARWRHRRDLMMSRDEVKQEHRSSEGDPHHKARRRSLHRQLAGGGPARGVQAATAVVVNPTHIAVALRYAASECDAPYIVAKAREEDAVKLRTQAQQLGIPVVRDVPLARTLIHSDVGEEVPEELYKAAAAVLKVALEQSGGTQEETP